MSDTIFDGAEQPTKIVVGSYVKVNDDLHLQQPGGTVMEITDPDGDYDDDTMRPVMIPPKIFVKWDDDDRDWSTLTHNEKWQEGWSTYESGFNWHTPTEADYEWTCDDLLVIPNVGNEPQTKE